MPMCEWLDRRELASTALLAGLNPHREDYRVRVGAARGVSAWFFVAVGITGSVACSADSQEKAKSSTARAQGTSTTSPATPSDEPTPTTTPTVPAALAHAMCLGRQVTGVGTAGPDRLGGGPGRDVFLTLGGDDIITNVGDRDRVCTGAGNDTVETLTRDTSSRVDLGTGSDTFRGNASTLLGGTGDDQLHVRGVTQVEPGPGHDLIAAAPADDLYGAPCVSYSHATRGIVANLGRGWVRAQGIDRVVGVQCLYGSQFPDRITGSPQADLLYLCAWVGSAVDHARNIVHAGAGDDEVNGCDGGDVVHLGDGKDFFLGGTGDDWADGGEGADAIHGLAGSDHLEGGEGDDRVNGTFYCDTASSAGDGMGDGSGNEVYGGSGNDEVTGDRGHDRIDGGPGTANGYGGPPGREGSDVIVSVEKRTSCP